MNDFQSHANLTSIFDVYIKAFKRRLAFGTLKLFLLESLWIEHSSTYMVKMQVEKLPKWGKESWQEETAIAVVSFGLMTVKLLDTFSSSLLQGFVTRRNCHREEEGTLQVGAEKDKTCARQTEIEATNPCHLFLPYPLHKTILLLHK